MTERYPVLLNPGANSGKGLRRWARVQHHLSALGCPIDVAAPASRGAAETRLRQWIDAGTDVIVAAGGDGTVNLVVNALMQARERGAAALPALAAIGIGSSNDFHKPVTKSEAVAGVPLRLNRHAEQRIDIGRARIVDRHGRSEQRFFCLNASVGFVAEANAYFNTSAPLLTALKRLHVEVAIIYTVLYQLFRFRALPVTLTIDGATEQHRITNVSVLNKVHLAGGMQYDTPVTWNDGLFDIARWDPMSRRAIVKTIIDLYRGRFSDKPNTAVMRTNAVRIESPAPLTLELDGEVCEIQSADIEILPQALTVWGAGYDSP